ncbi:MAG: TonB-dependent receptor, partial [Candidatus Firestonebacteria bacterium]
FQNNIRNMIQWMLDPVSSYFMPLNVGNARTLGIESEIKFRPVEGISLYANHTWLSAQDTDKNKDLYYRPKNKINLGFEAKACIFKLNVDSEYYDTRQGIDAVTYADLTLPSVIVSSAKLSAKVSAFSEIILSVNNLENVQYELRSGYPMPGRAVSGGVNLKF